MKTLWFFLQQWDSWSNVFMHFLAYLNFWNQGESLVRLLLKL